MSVLAHLRAIQASQCEVAVGRHYTSSEAQEMRYKAKVKERRSSGTCQRRLSLWRTGKCAPGGDAPQTDRYRGAGVNLFEEGFLPALELGLLHFLLQHRDGVAQQTGPIRHTAHTRDWNWRGGRRPQAAEALRTIKISNKLFWLENIFCWKNFLLERQQRLSLGPPCSRVLLE